jgi:hypothetical protein
LAVFSSAVDEELRDIESFGEVFSSEVRPRSHWGIVLYCIYCRLQNIMYNSDPDEKKINGKNGSKRKRELAYLMRTKIKRIPYQ